MGVGWVVQYFSSWLMAVVNSLPTDAGWLACLPLDGLLKVELLASVYGQLN